MNLKVAYNKIDNLCCLNSSGNSNFFDAYKDTQDEDFCKDTNEMVEALETIKEVVDLQDDLGCPLAIVGKLLLHKERYIYTVEKSKLTGKDFMDKHKVVGVSDFGVCILTTNWLLKTEPKYYEWNEYKKTFWLREDKSE